MAWRGAPGFTLIELLITVAILAILAQGAASLASVAARHAREAELRSDLRQIRNAIDAYKKAYDDGHIQHTVDATGYPPTLDVLADGVIDIKSPNGARIYFLRRIPHDPMASSDISPSASWGLRSYASPPDDPSPGDDVYDVHSLSDQVGLDGTPYRQW